MKKEILSIIYASLLIIDNDLIKDCQLQCYGDSCRIAISIIDRSIIYISCEDKIAINVYQYVRTSPYMNMIPDEYYIDIDEHFKIDIATNKILELVYDMVN